MRTSDPGSGIIHGVFFLEPSIVHSLVSPSLWRSTQKPAQHPDTLHSNIKTIFRYSHTYCCSVATLWPNSFATPWTVAYQVPLSMGFPRQEYWSGLPFLSPGGYSQPRDWTCVSLHWQAGSLPLSHQESPICHYLCICVYVCIYMYIYIYIYICFFFLKYSPNSMVTKAFCLLSNKTNKQKSPHNFQIHLPNRPSLMCN